MVPDGRGMNLTVAIATIDRPHSLARCVHAILTGTHLPAELVIVDQSLDDRTAVVVATADWDRCVRLRYLRRDRRGLAASRNVAIAEASTPTLVFTDDDCVPHVAWLGTIANAFGGAARPDIVTGRVLPLNAGGARLHPAATRTSQTAAHFHRRAIPWAVGTGGNAAVRREWLERIGGFDERLGMGSPGQSAEDMDLFYRLLRSGARARYEPAAVVFHERKDRRGMIERAQSYGFGMGAFCAMQASTGDPYAFWIALRWCLDRAQMCAGTCCLTQWGRARDEIRMVQSAGRGVAYGLTLRSQAPAPRPTTGRTPSRPSRKPN